MYGIWIGIGLKGSGAKEGEMIRQFTHEHRFLSNFWPSHIFHEGIGYPTVEHAYQAAKTLDQSKRIDISRMSTPGDAKRAGRLLEIREDWDKVKFQVMLDLVRIKFGHHGLRESLLGTGAMKLVEGNTWHDNFWGVCSCGKCPEGENKLGRILMQVREEVRRK